MKKIALLIVNCFLLLSSCQSVSKSNDIMIASDLHFLGDEITSKVEKYNPSHMGADGRVQEADDSIVEAIIDVAKEKKPGVLILSGDLVYNGEKQSHIELANKLKDVPKGTQVLVTPGNHDILAYETYSFASGELVKCKNTTPEEFKEIYANHGYNQALTLDTESLSYIYALNDKQWIVMLDSAMYYQNEFNGFTTTGGFILKSTQAWLEEYLIKAQNEGIEVITCMHHNLAIHNDKFTSGYQLYNSEEVINLLTKYHVKLNLSGHLHIQSIMKCIGSNSNEIVDIASNSSIVYGNTYGYIKTDGDYYQYTNEFLPVKWETNFKEYSLNRFIDRYSSMIKNKIDDSFTSDEKEKIVQLVSKANAYYFAGRSNEMKDELTANEELLNRFKTTIENYDNSYYKTYLEDSIDKNNVEIKISKN